MRVGSLVEVVTEFPNCYGICTPIKGPIYTVRGFHPLCELGIWLEEIDNSLHANRTEGGMEPSFDSRQFRELLPPMSINLEEILCLQE